MSVPTMPSAKTFKILYWLAPNAHDAVDVEKKERF